MGRTILGVLAGVVVAWLVIMLCQFGSTTLHPPPPGIDLRDPVQLAAFVAAAPVTAMALVLASYALGALLGGWAAARVARHKRAAALVIGALVLAGVIANFTLIPHPLWMTVAGLLLPLPAAWLGMRLAQPRPHPHR